MEAATKTILCFGDSNTWGYIPASDSERYPPDIRWPGVMASLLGAGFKVIEEAQNGRTTVFDDALETIDKNGGRHLPIVLESQKPVDLVVVMLGTNDLKIHLGLDAHAIAAGAGALVERIRASGAGPGGGSPQVLLVAPPAVADSACPFGHIFDGAAAKSAQFPAAFREVAQALDVPLLDASTVATCPPTDCIHLDEEGHAALGKAVGARAAEMFGG